MIAILQPHIPHFRKEFFEALLKNCKVKIYTYNKKDKVIKEGFSNTEIKTTHVKNFSFGPFLIYNIWPFLNKNYKVLVLMGSIKHLSTWVLLFLNIFLKKDIILWGHGISIRRYEREQHNQLWLRKLFYKLAKNAWFYTPKELEIWKNELPDLNSISLNNTISGIDEIIDNSLPSASLKESLKNKYNIDSEINLIICTRFSKAERKTELLLNLLNRLNTSKYGLIVIGNGPLKPNFSNYRNVYDFGEVYNFEFKKDLFSIADLYIQPGWIGLSGVEALAHGIPVCTLKRSKRIHQCVEYNYLTNNYNSIIANSINELFFRINRLSGEEIEQLKENSKNYARENLSMSNMVNRTLESLDCKNN